MIGTVIATQSRLGLPAVLLGGGGWVALHPVCRIVRPETMLRAVARLSLGQLGRPTVAVLTGRVADVTPLRRS